MADPLPVLQSAIRACTSCWLHDHGEGPVPYRGPIPAAIVVVGEAPGDVEDRRGEPFMGKAGKYLMAILHSEAGTPRSMVGFCNVVSCWPGRTRKKAYRVPAIEEQAACRDNLEMQLAVASPDVVILAGGTALQAFRPDMTISQARGRPFLLPGSPNTVAVPTWHPSACLRAHDLKEAFESDIKQAYWRARRARHGIDAATQRWPNDCAFCTKVAVRFDADLVAYCQFHANSRGIDESTRPHVSTAVPMTLEAPGGGW